MRPIIVLKIIQVTKPGVFPVIYIKKKTVTPPRPPEIDVPIDDVVNPITPDTVN